jgi:hypothetical protein
MMMETWPRDIGHTTSRKVRHDAIGVRWKIVMLDAAGIDVALLDPIPAYNRHPQLLTQFLR